MSRKCHGVQKQTEDTNAGVGARSPPTRGSGWWSTGLPQNIEAVAEVELNYTITIFLFTRISGLSCSFTAHLEDHLPGLELQLQRPCPDLF